MDPQTWAIRTAEGTWQRFENSTISKEPDGTLIVRAYAPQGGLGAVVANYTQGYWKAYVIGSAAPEPGA